jgi:hypothetical protein
MAEPGGTVANEVGLSNEEETTSSPPPLPFDMAAPEEEEEEEEEAEEAEDGGTVGDNAEAAPSLESDHQEERIRARRLRIAQRQEAARRAAEGKEEETGKPKGDPALDPDPHRSNQRIVESHQVSGGKGAERKKETDWKTADLTQTLSPTLVSRPLRRTVCVLVEPLLADV